MKIETGVLQEALKSAMYFVSRRSTVVTYTHFLLDGREGTLKIGGANFGSACRWDTETPCNEELFVTVPAKIFYGDINGINAETTDLSLKGRKLVVSTERHTAKIDVLPGDQFPDIRSVDGFTQVNRSLLDAIMTCAIAVNPKDAKPTLHGMHLRTEGQTLEAFGTDGYRAGHYQTAFPYDDIELGITIPKDSATAIGKATKGMDAIDIATDGQALALRHNGSLFTSQLLDGQYPHVWDMMQWNEDDHQHVTVQAEDFKDTLKRSLVFSKDGLHGRIDLKAEGQNLVVTAASYNHGKSVTEIPAEVSGPAAISINAQYLYDFVTLYSGDDDITIFIQSGRAPMYMRGSGVEGFEYLVMPVDVSES